MSDSRSAGGASFRHPLLGANPRTLWRVLRDNGGAAPRAVPVVVLAGLAAVLRWPFSSAERLLVQRRHRHGPAPPAPVFIVGHWRSGTTHLYNLLSQSPQFAYVSPVAAGLPWDFLVLGRLLRPLLRRALPAGRFIDRVAVRPDSPQEDEIALASMQEVSYYHGIYFPRHLRRNDDAGVFFDGCSPAQIRRWQQSLRHLLDKLAIEQPGQRPLIKNPVYTARVGLLRQMWPQARFIHIHRNPYTVFQSTRNFYHALLPQLALQPYQGADIDALILERYPRMMDALLDDAAHLPQDAFVEVRFEDFEHAPLAEVERIYRTLGLPGFDGDCEAFQAYLEGTADYRKNRYRFPEADRQRVERHWGRFIERWGYAPP